MTKSTGFKIKKLRESIPLSQEEMAIELGVSQSTLCKIENGSAEKKVDFALMDKICKLFKVDPKYFLEDSFSQTNKEVKNTNISLIENPTVNNYFPENVVETILNNQNQITLLLENQNRLIGKIGKLLDGN